MVVSKLKPHYRRGVGGGTEQRQRHKRGRERQEEQGLKATLSYVINSRPAWAKQDAVSKNSYQSMIILKSSSVNQRVYLAYLQEHG